jgi:hypothetical protein
VKLTPLLATPPTVTTTFPEVAPVGTVTVMLVALQLVGVATVPLNVTVLVPCVAPKFVPVMVTIVPTGPDVGLILARLAPRETAVGVLTDEQPDISVATSNKVDMVVRSGRRVVRAQSVIMEKPPGGEHRSKAHPRDSERVRANLWSQRMYNCSGTNPNGTNGGDLRRVLELT